MCLVLVIVAKLFLKSLKDQNYIRHFEQFFAVEIMMFNVDRNADNDDAFRHIEKTATISSLLMLNHYFYTAANSQNTAPVHNNIVLVLSAPRLYHTIV